MGSTVERQSTESATMGPDGGSVQHQQARERGPMRTKKFTPMIVVAVLAMALAVPAAANAAWGSIALNVPTGQAGVAFNEPTKSAAKQAAIKDCPGKCRAALYVQNKCGAIAINAQ